MTQKWTGSDRVGDVKSAYKTGFIYKTWDNWEMYGLDGNDTLTGGEIGDKIYGGEGFDDLNGLGGNDYLDGGESADKMYGGTGNDTFVVDHDSDQAIERAGEGIDEIHSYAFSYTMPRYVENLRLMDDAKGAGRFATGNTDANTIYGNKWSNRIFGMDGNDTIYGNGGTDHIDGGEGDDRLFSSEIGSKAFGQGGNDSLFGGGELYGGQGNDTYTVFLKDSSTIIEYADEGFDVVQVNLITPTGQASNEVYQMSESMLHVERVELVGVGKHLEGNSSPNQLVANPYVKSILNGMGGDDGLIGMDADDTIIGGEGNDAMYGGKGNDFISGYGGSNAKRGNGRDFMHGGAGKDVFQVKDFYLDEGYVKIADFSRQDGDKVQIKGSIGDYLLRIDYQETRLLHKASGDLVAVFDGTDRPALDVDFQYVS